MQKFFPSPESSEFFRLIFRRAASTRTNFVCRLLYTRYSSQPSSLIKQRNVSSPVIESCVSRPRLLIRYSNSRNKNKPSTFTRLIIRPLMNIEISQRETDEGKCNFLFVETNSRGLSITGKALDRSNSIYISYYPYPRVPKEVKNKMNESRTNPMKRLSTNRLSSKQSLAASNFRFHARNAFYLFMKTCKFPGKEMAYGSHVYVHRNVYTYSIYTDPL